MFVKDVNNDVIASLQKELESSLPLCSTFEEAGQKFTNLIYSRFSNSIVLARLFITVPFEKLPNSNKNFVKDLTSNKGVSHLLNDKTSVLSLAGSSGIKYSWNDRRKTEGHVGIPLLSAEFIDLIPMMSRLLRSLGVSLEWISSTDTEIVAQTIGKIAGVFYVPDAGVCVDEKGRKIIAQQDFVEQHKIKTVFGFGGGYVLSNAMITAIIFTQEELEKSAVELFLSLVNTVKNATVKQVCQHKIFLPS